jgi:predicted Zn-dependent protease
MKVLRTAFTLFILVVACGAPAQNPKETAKRTDNTVLLGILQTELQRAMTELSKRDPAPYFISYSVTDRWDWQATASEGALFNSGKQHLRGAAISVRIASPELDNTHNEGRSSGIHSVLLPIEDDPDAIARVLWAATDQEYKNASQAYLQMKTNTAVRAQEEDKSPDFSKEAPQTKTSPVPGVSAPDMTGWEKQLRKYSSALSKFPNIYNSAVFFTASDATRYFVSTEGSRVVTHQPNVQLVAQADTRAEDGMDLVRSENFAAADIAHLPTEAQLMPKLEKLGEDLEKLRTAPVVEPYSGPAMLSGRAAAVFFHEVLGHRIEGQRQRGVQEGQTFTKKLNQLVLPDFLSVTDDPTLKELGGVQLNGTYDFDSEGVAAQRTPVIENGVLKQFLLSRLPVSGFEHSNGHGRAQDGAMPTGRQGNLIISASKSVPFAELRKMLIAEVTRQNKPYGLYFEDIAGGFTLTTRAMPQAFQVLPLVVWRVYADGRPDELVRGVDIVGTPLTAMTRIMAAGDKTEVFNGICGAESGQVPVAAASPAMLFSEIEVQKRRLSQARPPILAAPPRDAKAVAGTGVSDPLLLAMKAELERSTADLQLEKMQRPYFIEYRVTDDDTYDAEAEFGATQIERRVHGRLLRVSVRVGSYKQDSSGGRADGVMDLAPAEDDIGAIRHRIWLATDSAYKAAIEALSSKQAQLKQFENEQLPDDFSHEKPAQFIGPLATLEVDSEKWKAILKTATAGYRADPELEAMDARVAFHVQNKYLVNSEGSMIRQPEESYSVMATAGAQAPDGRRIDRGYSRVVRTAAELPSAEDVRKGAQKLIDEVAALRKAPVVEDQYRGPVLMGPDASGSVFARLLGTSVLGRKPRPGATARTTGDFATSWKARVLPDFLEVTDDPTVERFGGRTLMGSYKYDDEAVEARPVKIVEHGTLTNFLVGRQPIRDFTASNGHGRGASTRGTGPALGNLFVKSTAPVSFADLKKKLIEICKDRELPYCYYVESSTGASQPEQLFRIYSKDGHSELVRGAEFVQLDTRTLRSNVIAAGDDLQVNNRLGQTPDSIIAPSLLFDELEIRKSGAGRDKLPDYPPPAMKR